MRLPRTNESVLIVISSSPPSSNAARFVVHVAYEDAYVNPLILSALSKLPANTYQLLPSSLADFRLSSERPYLQITSYESLSHDALLSNPSYIGNSYTIRKALIRKHYLANTVASWLPKHPESLLKKHVPLTISFELDYAEFLDDALLEAWELHESWSRNEDKPSAEREWWILKPGMSDRGQGIRLFSTEMELSGTFEEWEAENRDEDDSNDDDDGNHETEDAKQEPSASAGLVTSQLRHFIAQPYIPPLLLPSCSNRKFHIRSYVLCVGALSVYVYRDMLALFAAELYIPPGKPKPHSASETDDTSAIDMTCHLTNTCLQDADGNNVNESAVQRYWDLPDSDNVNYEEAFKIICATTAELFRAAAANPTSFQPLPNAFEVFGVDWLLDYQGRPWLLEVNAFPDFKQTGKGLSRVVEGFWEGVMNVVGEKLLGLHDMGKGGEGGGGKEREGMYEVLDLDLGRR